MTLTHLYVGTYSYDYASYDAFVQSKIAFFKFTGSKAESFSNRLLKYLTTGCTPPPAMP